MSLLYARGIFDCGECAVGHFLQGQDVGILMVGTGGEELLTQLVNVVEMFLEEGNVSREDVVHIWGFRRLLLGGHAWHEGSKYRCHHGFGIVSMLFVNGESGKLDTTEYHVQVNKLGNKIFDEL